MIDKPPKEWWQQGSDRAFRELLTGLPTAQLEHLAGEIGGALAVIQGQLEGSARDEDWRKRANMARGFIAARKAAVRAELQARNEARASEKASARAMLLAAARNRLEAGDVAGALRAVLDLLGGAHAKK